MAPPLIGALFAALTLGSGVSAETFKVKVKADGSFDPQTTFIHDGDSVEWDLRSKADSVIPVLSDLGLEESPDLGICTQYKPFHPNGANEFTGPQPHTASGVFTLSPYGAGLVEVSGTQACGVCEDEGTLKAAFPSAGLCLCETGQPFASMDATWNDPEITGVFIRPLWSAVHKGPGRFFWDDIDREIDKAVKNGKLYSLVFKAGSQGTPEWIFRPQSLGPVPRTAAGEAARTADGTVGLRAVERLHFRDGGSKLEPGQCGPADGMDLGSPADENYRKYYFELLRAVAAHIREKNAWYRALAYIKPSGLNLHSSENRLPNSCEPGCLCNTEVWAKEGLYTPTALKEFYEAQLEVLAEEFPDKDMSYMLIQAGFPQVNDHGEYLGQAGVQVWTGADVPADKCSFPGKGTLPGGTQQTECVLQAGKEDYGVRFVVQHNGLGPLCGDGPDDDAADDCLPNRWAKSAAKDGQIIGYQTNNALKVGSTEELEAAFQNGYCNSEATFFEIYEERLWELRKTRKDGVLDGNSGAGLGPCNLSPSADRTIADWAQMLHVRREQRGLDLGLLQAFPAVHRHSRFSRRTGTSATQLMHYVHGSKCDDGPQPKYGVIAILPTVSTSPSLSTTPASGYDVIIPALPPGKPTSAVVHSRGLVASSNRLGLKGLSLGEDAGTPCSLSLTLRDLPGPPVEDSVVGMTTTWSGPETCSASAATSTKAAVFSGAKQFVRGVSVCTSGDIPQVRGIRVFAATVDDDGTVGTAAQSTESLTLGGCSNWQPPRYCPKSQIAVGVKSYFTASGGFTGIALQCKAVEAH
jgi:hypothetical protein